jgi:spermidine synthase
MAASTPERQAARVVLTRALLAGAGLGALCIAGAGLVLYDAGGLLAGATGLTATILAALLTGIWAGAPREGEEPLPFIERWIAAGTTTAVAGGFATFLTLYGTDGAGPVLRIVSLLALVAVPVYAVGMLLPVLLAWGERIDDEICASEEIEPGRWNVLGALVAGMLGGAALGVVATGMLLVTLIGPGPLLLGVAVMLFAPVVIPEPQIRGADERLLAEVHTPLSHIRVTEMVFPGERQPERRLYLGEEQESGELVRSGAPTLAYIVAAESWLTATAPPAASYLFLGGGAYTLPRRIAERDPSARITVVELDPVVTRLAARFFGLHADLGIRSVHGDARAFLDSADRRWDRIYLDVYAGTESLPFSLVTSEAFAAARNLLSDDGVLGINLIGIVGGDEAVRVWSVVRTIREIFPSVAVYSHFGPDYPDRQNLLVLAATDASTAFPPRAGIFDRWPEAEWPAQGTVVYHDLGAAVRPAQSPAGRERVN